MNKQKMTSIIIGLTVVGGVALVALSAQPKMMQPKAGTSPLAANTAGDKSYTLAQVATHKDSASCWTAINGGVYDLTSWISQHPGGEGAILSICGKDGSAAFNAQHGGQSRPEQELATFKIGSLKK
jgi:cytochrome b involved in lipid metabolism